MGNALACVFPLEREARKGGGSSKAARFPRSKTRRQAMAEEELLQKQALAMALLQQQLRFERSASVHSQKSSITPKQNLPRSSSARARHVSDPVLKPYQLLQSKECFSNLKTRHFVLIHGGGFGAWCWYKIIALLEDTGFFTINAIDLAGSGIDPTDPNSVTDIQTYARPLIRFLEKIPLAEKVLKLCHRSPYSVLQLDLDSSILSMITVRMHVQVILVGHDVGGACMSYAMELFPQKIAKSVFVSATMIGNRQSAFDVFAPEVAGPDYLLRKAQIFNYEDKSSQSPTSIEFDKAYVKELFFNQSPAKDVALATVSLRPVPFGPLMEKISCTSENYGIIPRYYVVTGEDHALTTAMQENLVEVNPPIQVFRLKGGDHAPFFSRPQALCKVLLEIAQIDATVEAK